MQLAGPGVFGPPADREQAKRVLRRAVELGVDPIDTSDFYGPWVVNELIAEALRPYPEGLRLVTKVGAYRDHEGNWPPINHPAALKSQVHDNLRRLGVDSIDLVHLRHTRAEPGISLEHTRIETVQNLYNVVDRTSEPLLRRTAELGTAFIPFFPLGSGFSDSRARQDETLSVIAQRHGVTQAQVSLAWLLQRSANVLLIPGTSAVEHLEENVAAAELQLTDRDLTELNA
jgi:aryl-alcohol dehydrogenase-like predicted oxidoreductase